MTEIEAAVLDAAHRWLGTKEEVLAADEGMEDPSKPSGFAQAEYELTGAVYRLLGREPRMRRE